MTESADVEAGTPTLWDNAWREGHAKGLEHGLRISYREAYKRTMLMLTGAPLDTSKSADVQTLNDRGEWVPGIPLPFYGLRKRCECGRKFWTAEGYRGHYALAHTLGLI
jgi:hypothetical protein